MINSLTRREYYYVDDAIYNKNIENKMDYSNIQEVFQYPVPSNGLKSISYNNTMMASRNYRRWDGFFYLVPDTKALILLFLKHQCNILHLCAFIHENSCKIVANYAGECRKNDRKNVTKLYYHLTRKMSKFCTF